jgi:hypothetical protein
MEILNLNECASCNFLTQSSKRKAKSHSVKFKALNFKLWFYALSFTLFAIFVSLCLFASPAAQAAVGPNWIEQWGITWTFDKDISADGTPGTYQYGQFCNGDYWVKGPVNIISINPPCHVTVAGEKDEYGADYNSYVSCTGIGAWSCTDGSYPLCTILTSNASGLVVDQFLLVRNATGADSNKVNFLSSHKVKAINPNVSFTIQIDRVDSGIKSSSVISGGTFGGQIINGSEINPPILETMAGYTSAAAYKHSLNAAWSISADNPNRQSYITVPANSSLISTVSRVLTNDDKTYVNKAQILTVLPSDAFAALPVGVTPSDCFRPHYYGIGDKAILYYKTEMDDSFLVNLPLIAEQGQGKPTLSGMTDQFARPWVRIINGGNSGVLQPLQNMPCYYMAAATNNGARVLNSSDYTLEQKQSLLIGYIQSGIDLFGPYAEGSLGYPPDGGTQQGFMLPILAFGKAFDAYWINKGQTNPVWAKFQKMGNYRYSAKPSPATGNYNDGDLPPDYIFFHELDQTFYVSQLHVDLTQNLFRGVGEYLHDFEPWHPDTRTTPNIPYTVDMIGTPDWGIRHSVLPAATDGAFPQSNYRLQNSVEYPHMQIMALAWGVKDKVNHDAWFDYTDRWASYYADQPDPNTNRTRTWKAYRHLYGPIWPEKAVIIYGDVSGDGLLSAYDAALAARIAVGLDAYPTGDNLTKADVSGDGFVTAYDAALIAQRAVGLITKFPVES